MKTLVAKIEQGQLKGKLDKDYRGKEFISFLGVPYAKPPIGKLRFLDPKEPEPWIGIKDATKAGDHCYGLDILISNEGVNVKFGGSEDCLYLNIHTHGLKDDIYELKPVMVYFHGGGFTTGSGNPQVYGAQILMTEDVVLITVNYRTGALGFLSIDSLGIANAGLKDSLQALIWVKENIAEFGGDPNNVTIFGESAGGAVVQYLMLSPIARGLFHKAISQSGSALNTWSRGKSNNYRDLAKAMNFNGTDDKEIFQFFKDLPVDDLYKGQYLLKDYFNSGLPRFFGPVIEKSSRKAFLSEEPLDLMHSGKYNQVPLIMGYTSYEGSLIYIVESIRCSLHLDNCVPYFLGYEGGSDAVNAANAELTQYYFGSKSVDHKNVPKKIDMATDNFFLRGINSSVKAHAKSSIKPTYYYKATAITDLNASKKLEFPGLAHADELVYLFGNAYSLVRKENTIEDITTRRFVKLWTNFAKTGDPTPITENPLTIQWKPVTEKDLNFLEIGLELKTGVNPDGERMKVWDKALSGISSRY